MISAPTPPDARTIHRRMQDWRSAGLSLEQAQVRAIKAGYANQDAAQAAQAIREGENKHRRAK